MKNKIGILTFQNAINYGASLQTYALNKFINNNNYDCETINYKCKYIEKTYQLISFDINDIKRTINMILNLKNNVIRRKKFKKFKKKNIRMSKKSVYPYNINKLNDIYNVFITGSDQVWNLELCNDFNYYLPFVNNNNKRISFAASFGNIDVFKKNNETITKELSKYDNISVREKSAKDLIEKTTNIKADHVLDPTFLLDYNEWEKIIPKHINKEKYVLLYVLHEEDSYEIAKKIGNETGYKVYIITQSRRKKINGKYIRNSGPLDFLSLIKNSEYVVTDSFHGTALSIIFRKNLKVVLKNKNVYLNDRLLSVLNEFKLEDCIVNTKTSIDELIKEVNYSNSEEIISSEIDKTKEFIINSLKGKNYE